MPATATAAPSEWVDGLEAASILGIGPDARPVRRLAALGRIGTRDLPVKARYRRLDVEAIAATAVRPARVALS